MRARTAILAALVVLSGGVVGTALSSPAFALCSWFCLLPLFLALRLLRPLRALAAGALWGATIFVAASLQGGVGPRPQLALLLLPLLPAAFAAMGSFVVRRLGFQPLLLGLAWAGVELALRPLSLKNGLLAGTQGNGPLLSLVGAALGYVCVAVLIALVNAAFLQILTEVRAIWDAAGSPRRGEDPRPEYAAEPSFLSPARVASVPSIPRSPPGHSFSAISP